MRGGVVTTGKTSNSSYNGYYPQVVFSKNGSTSNPWSINTSGGEQHGYPRAIGQIYHSEDRDYATSYMWAPGDSGRYCPLYGRTTTDQGYTFTFKDSLVRFGFQRGLLPQVVFSKNGSTNDPWSTPTGGEQRARPRAIGQLYYDDANATSRMRDTGGGNYGNYCPLYGRTTTSQG